MEILLKNNADVKAQDHKRHTALHLPAMFTERMGVKGILESCHLPATLDIIDKPDCAGLTALHLSVNERFYDGVEVLLYKKANIGATDELGRTALHFVVMTPAYRDVKESLLEILFEKKAEVYGRDKTEQTPLHLVDESQRLGGDSVRFIMNELYIG